MNWNERIICQPKTKQALRFKELKNFDALSVYGKFIENNSKRKKFHDMPVDLLFEAVLPHILFYKNASCITRAMKSLQSVA